jgi:hypothetical protein
MKTIIIVTLILFNTKVFANCQSDTSKYCSQYDARVQNMFIKFCLWQNINKLSSSCKSGLISERDQQLKTKNTRQKQKQKQLSNIPEESKSNKKRVSISELFKQYKKKQDQKKKNSSSNTRSNAKYTNTSSISYKKQLERIKKLIKEAHRNKEKYKTK